MQEIDQANVHHKLKKQEAMSPAIIKEEEPEEVDLYEERKRIEGRIPTYINDFINLFVLVGVISIIVALNLQPILNHLEEIRQEKEEKKKKELLLAQENKQND